MEGNEEAQLKDTVEAEKERSGRDPGKGDPGAEGDPGAVGDAGAQGDAGAEEEGEEEKTWPHQSVKRTAGTSLDCGETELQMSGIASIGGSAAWIFEDEGTTYIGNVVPQAGRGYMRSECVIGGPSGIGYPGLVIPRARIRTLLRASRGVDDVQISRSGSTGAGDGIILWSTENWHEIRGVRRQAEVMAERYRKPAGQIQEWGGIHLTDMYERLRLCQTILAEPKEGQEWGRVHFYEDGFMTAESEQHFARLPYEGTLRRDVAVDIRVLTTALRMHANQIELSGDEAARGAVEASVLGENGIIYMVAEGPESLCEVSGEAAYDHGSAEVIAEGQIKDGLHLAQSARVLNATIPRRSAVRVKIEGDRSTLSVSCSHREKGMRGGSSYPLSKARGEGVLSVNVVRLGTMARTMKGPTTLRMYARGGQVAYLAFTCGDSEGIIYGGMKVRENAHVKQLTLT